MKTRDYSVNAIIVMTMKINMERARARFPLRGSARSLVRPTRYFSPPAYPFLLYIFSTASTSLREFVHGVYIRKPQ